MKHFALWVPQNMQGTLQTLKSTQPPKSSKTKQIIFIFSYVFVKYLLCLNMRDFMASGVFRLKEGNARVGRASWELCAFFNSN